MQFDTTPDLPTRGYADLNGTPTPKQDKSPLQNLLDGLRDIMDAIDPYPYH